MSVKTLLAGEMPPAPDETAAPALPMRPSWAAAMPSDAAFRKLLRFRSVFMLAPSCVGWLVSSLHSARVSQVCWEPAFLQSGVYGAGADTVGYK